MNKRAPLLYKYPDATIPTIINIACELMMNEEFYIKVCHLMNIMCLEPPFELSFATKIHNKDILKEKIVQELKNKGVSDSELEENYIEDNNTLDKLLETQSIDTKLKEEVRRVRFRNQVRIKRRAEVIEKKCKARRLKMMVKDNTVKVDYPKSPQRIKAIRKAKLIPIELLSTKYNALVNGTTSDDKEVKENVESNIQKEEDKMDEEEISELPFGDCTKSKQEIFYTQAIPTMDLDEYYKGLMENINKPTESKKEQVERLADDEYNIWYSNREVLEMNDSEEEQWIAPKTLKEIRDGRTKTEEIKKYLKGITEETNKLYMKNIEKQVQEDHIQQIIDVILREHNMKDEVQVKIMKKGRMRDQGFVETNKREIAKIIKEELNGYMLFGKPIVIEYARAKN